MAVVPAHAQSVGTDALQLLQSVPNPLVVIGRDNALTFGNVAAEQFFHLSARMLTRLGLADMVSSTSPLIGLVEDVRTERTTINEYGIVIGTPRLGGQRTVDLQVTSVPESPDLVLVQIWPRSIAQRIDRQLTHRDAARTVTGMASMLAHEIKNPLSGIRGAAQLLEPALGDDDKALARLICDETDRIRDLVDQMEVFTDERPVERQSVNIHEVLDHVIALGKSGFAHRRHIEQVYDPSLPPVLGNRDQLVQVFLNLLKNACEADADRSRAILLSTAFRPGIRLTMPGSGVRMSLPLEVSIQNAGEAIPETVMAQLFEPFFTTKSGGKGLGLALVAKIVSDHSGIVDCESDDQRTIFRVLLPVFSAASSDASDDREMSS